MVNSRSSKYIVSLELKMSDIRREKARIILDKCIWLYFLFMITGVLGFVTGYVSSQLLNMMIISSFVILIIGSLPYITTVSNEEKLIGALIKRLKR